MKDPIDIAQELIKNGAMNQLEQLLNEHPVLSNQMTAHGISLLTFAAYCRNKEAVLILKDRKKALTFFESVAVGDKILTNIHLNKNPEIINDFSTDGFSGLGLACFFGHLKIAQLLVRAGAEINQPSKNSFNVYPIHSACAISNYEITEFLLQNGADANVQQQGGVTPLHSAAHNGNLQILKLLLNHQADVQAKMATGQTVLDMAKEKNHVEVVDYLRKRQ